MTKRLKVANRLRSNSCSLALAAAFAMVAISWLPTAKAIPSINLGTAAGFAILAGSQISDAGGATSVTNGNVGLSPATGAAIGLLPGQLENGSIYATETSAALLITAQNDLTTAYNDAASRPVTMALGDVDNQLGGLTLFPGVYSFGHAATANLIGTLTLDANGDLNPVWIFQATSDLVTAAGGPGSPGASVVFLNGAGACDVFWQVGSSATIGTYSDFAGHIMADQSIALQAYATLDGSALARIAAVTLDHNLIDLEACATGQGGSTSVPEAGSTLTLLGLTVGVLLFLLRRRS
ncbi:MAG: DUF3494 domain-containing protein [Opitutaceae bacterium]|nr:DUF3494 domain-containing protein [Opitutaceae bacterium]